MKYGMISVLIMAGLGVLEAKVGDAWQTDFAAAREDAIEENKLMLLYFTGSDWCQWCNKLDNELFADTTFRNGIGSHAVRLVLDFPQRPLPPRQERHNRRLKAQLQVEAFPEVVLYDPKQEKVLWRHSYIAVTADDYLKLVEAWKAKVEG